LKEKLADGTYSEPTSKGCWGW